MAAVMAVVFARCGSFADVTSHLLAAEKIPAKDRTALWALQHGKISQSMASSGVLRPTGAARSQMAEPARGTVYAESEPTVWKWER